LRWGLSRHPIFARLGRAWNLLNRRSLQARRWRGL
jgi:hypothetical protein